MRHYKSQVNHATDPFTINLNFPQANEPVSGVKAFPSDKFFDKQRFLIP